MSSPTLNDSRAIAGRYKYSDTWSFLRTYFGQRLGLDSLDHRKEPGCMLSDPGLVLRMFTYSLIYLA